MSDIHLLTLHLGSGIAGGGGGGTNWGRRSDRALKADQHTLQSFKN